MYAPVIFIFVYLNFYSDEQNMIDPHNLIRNSICRKKPQYSDTQKFPVITLKFEQDGFIKE